LVEGGTLFGASIQSLARTAEVLPRSTTDWEICSHRLCNRYYDGGAKVRAEARALRYGKSAIQITETDRAVTAEAVKARYRDLLVEGPTLTLNT
jgi:hypothetical protein